jgi:hypothetical protein
MVIVRNLLCFGKDLPDSLILRIPEGSRCGVELEECAFWKPFAARFSKELKDDQSNQIHFFLRK